MDNEDPHNLMQGTESTAEWTDEKHSMYLKSMETSFVDQLYDSKEMLSYLSLVKRTSSDSATMSGEFKVLRGGNWQKISFVRENPRASRINECPDLKANPWIQHYQSSGKLTSSTAPIFEETVTSTSQVVDSDQTNRFSSVTFQQDLVPSDTEMSDQNFTSGRRQQKKCKKTKNL